MSFAFKMSKSIKYKIKNCKNIISTTLNKVKENK